MSKSRITFTDTIFFRAFSSLIKLSDGRDKICKLLQYGSRSVVWFQKDIVAPYAKQHNIPWLSSYSLESTKKLSGLIATLSQARKIIRFMKWMYTFPAFTKAVNTFEQDQIFSYILLLDTVFSIITDFLDDVVFLYKLNFIPPFIGQWAERNVAKIWLISTILELTVILFAMSRLQRRVSLLKAKKSNLLTKEHHTSELKDSSVETDPFAVPSSNGSELAEVEVFLAEEEEKSMGLTLDYFKYVGDLVGAWIATFKLERVDENGYGLSPIINNMFALLSGTTSTTKLWIQAVKDAKLKSR